MSHTSDRQNEDSHDLRTQENFCGPCLAKCNGIHQRLRLWVNWFNYFLLRILLWLSVCQNMLVEVKGHLWRTLKKDCPRANVPVSMDTERRKLKENYVFPRTYSYHLWQFIFHKDYSKYTLYCFRMNKVRIGFSVNKSGNNFDV